MLTILRYLILDYRQILTEDTKLEIVKIVSITDNNTIVHNSLQ